MSALAILLMFAQQATGTISGTVSDSVTHKPVHSAQIRAANGPGDLTDAGGNYRLSGLPAGEVKLRIESSYRRLDTSAQLAQGDALKLDLELHPMAITP